MQRTLNYLLLIGSVLISSSAHAGGGHDHHGHGHDHDAHTNDPEENEPEKGPRGGRLLHEGALSLEVTIFEKGVPPQYRVYTYIDNQDVAPSRSRLSDLQIELRRFGDKTESFTFTEQENYLTSPKTVEEPHSFDVTVSAKLGDTPLNWRYQSHEGRTELSAEGLRAANVTIEGAGPQRIENSVRVYGRILPNEDRVAHIRARFPGIIKEIRKSLGDTVEKGDLLAVIESNQGLQPYEIRSQVSGTVVARHATLGEYIADTQEIFVVVNLSEVWADFQVYRDDPIAIEVGQSITIDLDDDRPQIPAKVTYVSPITDQVTQSKLIRAVLPNPNGNLRPGLFVSGELAVSNKEVPLAVKRTAIQSFRDWNVVYLTDGHTFQAMPVELGRKDAEYVEVLSGIESGDRYVSENSFIIKADIEKSGASHDH